MPTSDKGDLTQLVKDIEKVFEAHGLDDPTMGVAFTLPEDRKSVHWVTNVRRLDGIKLFSSTAEKMLSEVN